jgi:hypothetical protein
MTVFWKFICEDVIFDVKDSLMMLCVTQYSFVGLGCTFWPSMIIKINVYQCFLPQTHQTTNNVNKWRYTSKSHGNRSKQSHTET